MKHIFIALVFLAFAAGCAKSNDSTPVAAHAYVFQNGACFDATSNIYVPNTSCTANANSGYTMTNGSCIQTSTNQQVANGFCTSTTSGYYSNNGLCYSSANNQQVATTFCTNATSANGGQCYGLYIWSPGGNQPAIQTNCNGADCRGYTLIQASTGQTVNCQ